MRNNDENLFSTLSSKYLNESTKDDFLRSTKMLIKDLNETENWLKLLIGADVDGPFHNDGQLDKIWKLYFKNARGKQKCF